LRTGWTIAVLCAVCIALFTGCAMRGPLNWVPNDEPRPYTYHLSKWSRTGVSYQDIQSQIFYRATLFSPAFAKVLSEEKAERMGLNSSEAAQLLEESLKISRQELTIFVALVTKDPHWNDLGERAPTLIAKLSSDDGLNADRPTSVQRLTENEIADYRPFFPYADGLSTGYILTFKMPKRLDTLRLSIGGPPGLAEVEWLIEP